MAETPDKDLPGWKNMYYIYMLSNKTNTTLYIGITHLTFDGIVISNNDVHPSNADLPISVVLSGIVMFVSFLHP